MKYNTLRHCSLTFYLRNGSYIPKSKFYLYVVESLIKLEPDYIYSNFSSYLLGEISAVMGVPRFQSGEYIQQSLSPLCHSKTYALSKSMSSLTFRVTNCEAIIDAL